MARCHMNSRLLRNLEKGAGELGPESECLHAMLFINNLNAVHPFPCTDIAILSLVNVLGISDLKRYKRLSNRVLQLKWLEKLDRKQIWRISYIKKRKKKKPQHPL